MTFRRTKEAPMDFEYERSPFLAFNVFDSPHAQAPFSPEKKDHTPSIPIHNNNNFYVPEHMATKKDSPEVKQVITKLVDFTLDEKASPAVEPASMDTEDDDKPDRVHSPTIETSKATQSPSSNLPSFRRPMDTDEQLHTTDLHEHLYPIPTLHHNEARDTWIMMASGLLNIGCRIAFFTFAVYVVVQFAIGIRRDVVHRTAIYESNLLEEHFQCRMKYAKNRCDPSTRLPAMDELCRQWQQCLYRPMWVGRSKVLAETLGDIISGFFDTLSFKAMFFIVITVFGYWWTSSTATRIVQKGSHNTESKNKEIGWH
ncbi:Di-sulfide bridge nucleocytoplasmic transport domain-containing protein [Dichotomocladium elegans]|nr:Di-sulfide bridge nucleocytoplasmic transport domain-containing protein [Dichotomocladium elegans]